MLVIVYFFVVVFFLFKLDGAVKEGESGCGMEVIPTMLELKYIKMLTPAYNIIKGLSLIYVAELESRFGLEDRLALNCTQNTSQYREVPLLLLFHENETNV